MENLFWFLLIGLIAGWLAGLITKGSGFGIMGNILVGIIGALLGGFLFDVLGLGASGLFGSLVMAVIGAVALLALLGTVRRAE